MVHEKAKSGDPDYDDKVPMADQLGTVVTGPDGQTARIIPSLGPTDAQGQHVNLDEAPDLGDNRPKPGQVATEGSDVQVATPPAESLAAHEAAGEHIGNQPPKATPKPTQTSSVPAKPASRDKTDQ